MSPRPPPQSCDTFVVLPDLTKGGHVVFGKNSDRPREEVQEVVYRAAADHDGGSKVQVSAHNILSGEAVRSCPYSAIYYCVQCGMTNKE